MDKIKNMKIAIFAFAALLITSSLSAQQQMNASANVTQSQAKLHSQADTLQYTLGAFIGQWMLKNGFEKDKSGLFNIGMNDVINNRVLAVTDSTIIPRIAAYQLTTQAERNRQMEAQLFAELKGKSGIGALPNGVHYIVVKTGNGIRPAAKDSIVFNAIGIFPDGSSFEDTYKNKQPIYNLTSNLITGLSEAIQLMPEGSEWRIFIPSALAYGPAGHAGLIPPYTALVFDIRLEKVIRKKD